MTLRLSMRMRMLTYADVCWRTVRCGDECVLDDFALESICNRACGALDVLDIVASSHCAKALRGEVCMYVYMYICIYNMCQLLQ